MRLNEISFNDALPIDSYGPGFFRIGGEVIEGPVLLVPEGVSSWVGYEGPAPILKHAQDLDILFVGTSINPNLTR